MPLTQVARAERAAAAWFADYVAGGDPLFRFYRHEDVPGWRDGYDAALRGDAAPDSGPALAGWLCMQIWRGATK